MNQVWLPLVLCLQFRSICNMVRRKRLLRLVLGAGIVLTTSALALILGTPPQTKPLTWSGFSLWVKPMLTEKCLGCHGDLAKEVKGDFLVILARSFPWRLSFDDVLIPGDADYVLSWKRFAGRILTTKCLQRERPPIRAADHRSRNLTMPEHLAECDIQKAIRLAEPRCRLMTKGCFLRLRRSH